jgi:hypothetical protein
MWRNNPVLVIKRILIGFTVLLVFAFVYYEMRDVVAGPVIIMREPQNGGTATTSLIHVIGTVKNASQILLNDRQIYTDENGNFGEELLLAPGYNILELEAIDRFKHISKKQLELVYKVTSP